MCVQLLDSRRSEANVRSSACLMETRSRGLRCGSETRVTHWQPDLRGNSIPHGELRGLAPSLSPKPATTESHFC